MAESTLNDTYQYLLELVKRRRLKEVISQLGKLLDKCPDWDLQTSLEQVKTSYEYMLQYMVQGIVDPKRKQLYNDIVIRLSDIIDRIYLLLQDYESSKLYHILRNRMRHNAIVFDLQRATRQLESLTLDISVNSLLPDKDKQLETASRIYQLEKEIFAQTWTNISWSNEDEEGANYLLNSTTVAQTDICLYIGAVTMSLMQHLDIRKLLWLFDVYSHTPKMSARVEQRALVGLFFILHLYSDKLRYYPIITDRINALRDMSNISRDMAQCFINVINAHETEKITRIMNNEIMPGIMKNMNSGTKPKIPGIDDDNDDTPKMFFPQFEDKELESKLERLTKMSMEGGDLYMSTFQNMKGFSFFHDIENWFKPFDLNQMHVIKILNPDDKTAGVILKILTNTGYLCDNDKYSLLHLFPKLPLAQFDMMKDQLSQAEDAMKEEESKGDIMGEDEKAYKLENMNYMHDLYRFFKLSPRKKEFEDLFDVNVFASKELNCKLCSAEDLMLLSAFLFKKKYWKEAGDVFDTLIDMNLDNERNSEFLVRRGYIYQYQKKYASALEYYLKAEIFMPDDMWLKELLASCYRSNRQYDEALSYYRELEKANLDKVDIAFNIGLCLAEERNYAESFNYFYKVDFLESESLRAWRALSWYSFLDLKYDQSKEFLNKLINKSPNFNDYLIFGHVHWVTGNIGEAVNNYRQAMALCKDKDEFYKIFAQSSAELVKQGIDSDAIPLMMDII